MILKCTNPSRNSTRYIFPKSAFSILQSSLNDAFSIPQKVTSNVKTSTNSTSNYRASPSLPSHIPDVVSSARSEHSVVNMIKEEFKNPIRPPRRKKSSLPTTPVEVLHYLTHYPTCTCRILPLSGPHSQNTNYIDCPNTGLVRYLNGLFQLELGILIPDRSKTGQICPVFVRSISLDGFLHKNVKTIFSFSIKWSTLVDHLKTGPVFKWSAILFNRSKTGQLHIVFNG
jgi:hypothetical protein